MAAKIYGAFSLIGGGVNSLDNIDGANLVNDDAAIVFTSSGTYRYIVDITSGAAESSPDVIAPDNNAGDKRWLLVSNPFGTTKSDVGLADVPNTDFSTDISSNNAHRIDVSNPHAIDKTDVGLGNVADIDLSNVPNLDTSNASNITTGTLPSSVIPPVALVSVQVAANESAQLALTTEEGDVVVRTDESKSYMHNGGSAGTMSDFTELSTPENSVLSVNGDTGTVVLTKDDISLGNVTNVAQVAKGGDTMTGALVASDHGAESYDQVVNVGYGTSTPPLASANTIGTIFIKYIA